MSILTKATDSKDYTKKRIASLDFHRGLAIWMMTFLHGAANVYNADYLAADPGKIFDLPIVVIIFMSVIGFFAIWNSYFLFVSIIVNSYSFQRGILNGKEPKQILAKQILTGLGLLVVNIIDNSFLYSGFFGTALRTGKWRNTYPLWNGFFEMGTLRIIAWSMIITGIVLFFLLKEEGFKKYRRNIAILGIIAITIIAATHFVHIGIDNLPWEVPSTLPPLVDLGSNPSWPGVDFQALNASFRSWVLTIFGGDIQPLFPFLGTAFIGAIIGISLAQEKPHRKLPLFGILASITILALGGLFIGLGLVGFSNERPLLGNYFLLLGAQMIFLFLFLWLVEFRGKSSSFAQNRFVKHFRKWSMISLTIYCLTIYELLPRFLVEKSYNALFSTNINLVRGGAFGIGEEYKAVLMGIIVILFFELLIFVWSKINFVGSFEWMITNFVAITTKHQTKRLNVDYMMDKVQWVDYKELFMTSTGEKS